MKDGGGGECSTRSAKVMVRAAIWRDIGHMHACTATRRQVRLVG